MSPDHSFLFTWLYSVFGLISFHVPLLAFSCSIFACDKYIYIYFFWSLRLFFVVLCMVGLCNFVLMPISGSVQGLFVGFVHYVLEGLLTVTFLVTGFWGDTLELFCNVCNLPVIVNKVNHFYLYTVVLFG